MSSILKYAFRFVILLFVQVLIVGKLEIGVYVHPNIFLLFIILLPLNTSSINTLLIAFISGLLLDINTDTAGFNSTSFLVASYVRVYYLQNFSDVETRESSAEPNFSSVNIRWYLSYAGLIILSHHLIYSFIEGFRFRFIIYNLKATVSSSIASLILILLFQVLFFRIKKGVRA